ncbi:MULTISPECIES: TetR/AcrR family transcriptional regulator [Acetobacteraceae]|nr:MULTISPECIES: TetR/AcrR family transcriptional regulator [Acetobacteraceae]GAL98714.1 TetR family transcriptional regulator [Acetobacter tropicalis]GBR66791.1 TetR family transcriptional regulator [Acetobacter tropicalis NRIC 0312]GEL65405.1 putative TetR-family transcriptional regulator [Kozakia baliensis]
MMLHKAKKTYHHGDLRAGLLSSARMLLEEQGISALGLRAITRHAGVSSAAATPHFGNLMGLLSALATVGYEELAVALEPVLEEGAHAAGLVYVRFAILNPGLFTLMFRSDVIDRNEPALAAARARTSGMLTRLIDSLGGQQPQRTQAGTRAALWGKVHGLAVLAIDGFLDVLLSSQGEGLSLEDLLEDALR